jgi:hypothetical protein
LETEAISIPGIIESLKTRRDLLAGQVEEALKAEAHERQKEIANEQAEVAARLNAIRQAFLDGIAQLVQLLGGAQADKIRQAELYAESSYLVAAYTTPWPAMTRAGLILEEHRIALREAMRQFAWCDSYAGRQWREKEEQIRKEKSRIAQAEAVERRRVASSKQIWTHS